MKQAGMKNFRVETFEEGGYRGQPIKTRFVIDALSFFHAMDQMWAYIEDINKRRRFAPLWFTLTEEGIYD